MEILAPVNDYQHLPLLLEAGAKEVYLGGDDELFKLFSFTGRGKYAYDGTQILRSFEEVAEICKYAHSHGALVNFLGNIPFFTGGVYLQESMEAHFLRYIEQGLKAGADAVVIGDIGLIKSVHKAFPGVPIHASVYLRTLNRQQLLWLQEMGATRTVLSYHIVLEEIEALCKADIMEIEVIGYLGCSFFNGNCNFLHEFGEGLLDDYDPGIACKGIYCVSDEDHCETFKFFDTEAGCAACSLSRLEKSGVTALKIVGRGRDPQQIANVIQMYKQCIDAARKDPEYVFDTSGVSPIWKKIWCSKSSCKYNKKKNRNYSFYIGG